MEELVLDPQVRPRRRIFHGGNNAYYQRGDRSTEVISTQADGSVLSNSVVLPGLLRQAHGDLLLLEDGRLFKAVSGAEYRDLSYVPDVAHILSPNAVLTPEGYVYELLFAAEGVRKLYRLDESATLQQLGITRLQEDGQVAQIVNIPAPLRPVSVPGAVAAITDNCGLTLLLEDGRLYTRSGADKELELVEHYQPHNDQPLPRHGLLFHDNSFSILTGSKYLTGRPPDGARVLDGVMVTCQEQWVVITDGKERSWRHHEAAGRRIFYLS